MGNPICFLLLVPCLCAINLLTYLIIIANSTGFSNERIREAEKDSLNDEQGVISDSQDGGKFSMTSSPKRSSKRLLGLLTQNRSHIFLSSYPL